MLPIRIDLSRDEADQCDVVLAAAGIVHELVPRRGGYILRVREHDMERAEAELAAYERENPPEEEEEAPPPPAAPLKAWGGAVAMAAIAVYYAALGATESTPGLASMKGASARAICDGELFRAVTALFLHADFLHLIGNMAGFLVFGTAVCAAAGSGAGIFLMLLCGVSGNLLNACFHRAGHLSVGASTAVFGAVGLLTGLTLMHKRRDPHAWLAPAAGVLFIALLGNSERADLSAHGLGFVSGLAMGVPWGRFFPAPPGKKAQWTLFLAACVIVAAGFSG